MQMPVAVGLILAVTLLISFSGWFLNLMKGWQEFILDDGLFWYRVTTASLISVAIMAITFIGMAYAYECPGENNYGEKTILGNLSCESYYKIKTNAEGVFKSDNLKVQKENVEEPSMESFIE